MYFGEDTWGKDLIKTDNWYIGPVKDWETEMYGYELSGGVSDFIYNNCRKIMETEDQSEWAYNLLVYCFDLLLWNRRWPDELQDQIPTDRQCTTRFGSWVQKMRKKNDLLNDAINKVGAFKWVQKQNTMLSRWVYEITRDIKFRSQHDMTRDPYIAAYTCAAWMDAYDLIDTVSIPYYLYRPNTWAWHRYLKNPTTKNLIRFCFWDKFNGSSDKEFVQVLREMRWYAIDCINNEN